MERIYRFDVQTFREINEGMHSPILDPIGTVLSYSGLGISLTIAICSLLLFPKARRFVFPLLLELFVSGVLLSDQIKNVIHRERPSNMIYTIREEPHLISSFPSGHSTVSFGCAFMLLLLTWGTPQVKWGWIALVWAALVGFSRMYRGVHWPTDVAAGCMLGISSACLVYLVYRSWIEPRLGRLAKKTSSR